MLRLQLKAFNSLTKVSSNICYKHHIRFATALYISGDKAMEHTPAVQPFLDFEGTFQNLEKLENSIKYRKLSIDLPETLKQYEIYKDFINKIEDIESKREKIAATLKDSSKNLKIGKEEVKTLKAEGKKLRNELRELKEKFYPFDDEFVHKFLNLPNVLHKLCPINEEETIVYMSEVARKEEGPPHMSREDLFLVQDSDTYYMLEEAAIFDIDCTHAFTDHIILTGDFIQSSNPDFARAVILEAIATPITTYHEVIEKDVKSTLNKPYLVGGGAFESFLPDFAKLCLYPNNLPLRYAGFGRNYRKSQVTEKPNLFTVTQNNSVNTVAAVRTAEEADKEMENLLKLAIDFYKALGIHFRVVYVNAKQLQISECLRAQIEVYSPAEKRYIVVGHISNYFDFVSKRILFACQENKDYHFIHLVGGPVVYVSRLIAAMIENDIPLDSNKLLCHFEAPTELQLDKYEYTNDPEEFIKHGIDVYKNVTK